MCGLLSLFGNKCSIGGFLPSFNESRLKDPEAPTRPQGPSGSVRHSKWTCAQQGPKMCQTQWCRSCVMFPCFAVQVNNTALTSVSERSEEIIDHKKRKTVAVRKEKRKEKETHRGDKPGSAV